MVELTSLKISVVLWDKVALGVPQAPRDQLMATGLVWSGGVAPVTVVFQHHRMRLGAFP